MMAEQIIVRSHEDRGRACKRIMHRGKTPFTVSITQGALRSNAQNRLYHGYLRQIADQGDMTQKEYEALCKLEIGVPILRAADPEYRAFYDEHVMPWSYEKKILMMSEPFGFPVSRLMKTKQMIEYTDEIYARFTNKDFYLRHPDDALKNE